MDLKGKIVLITGSAKRVGKALAEACAARGAHVAVHYRRSRREAERLAAGLERGFGIKSRAFKADLEDARAAEGLARQVAKSFGGLHVLVNNASLYEKSRFGRTSVREWDRHLNANARAPFFLSQAAAPLLRRSGGGKIINIADWSALRPYAGYIPYCVSKAALLCLNTALAKALAPDIQVNAVLPGPVLLPEGTSARDARIIAKATLLKRLGSPKDVAAAVLFLIERGNFMTGAAVPVEGGRLVA